VAATARIGIALRQRSESGAQVSSAIAVTIAGSDSSGGAGIEADLKTFSALSVYGAAVITALTAQNTKGVFGILDVPAEFIAAQIAAVFTDLEIGAVKIGMLGSAGAIDSVAAALDRYRPHHVVLDPVMVATSGERLLDADAVGRLRELISRVHMVMPNLPEAAALLDAPQARDEKEMRAQAETLLKLGVGAVLIKGGHVNDDLAAGGESVDLLVEAGGCVRLLRRALRPKTPTVPAARLLPPSPPGSPKGLHSRSRRRKPKPT